jgi:hypothetical protein
MSMMNRSSLEQKTRSYWRDYDHGNPEQCLKQYIEELLPEEIEYARQREESKLPDSTCDTLVLLVGFSIEPLLQAVYVYNPRKVFLVLNQLYGQKPGKNWGKMTARLIGQLPEPPEIIEQVVIQAGPHQVFQALLDQVREIDSTVIDITGAKKNMVAGAFLYAALANVPVSYVDFADDAYDPEEGKPYGYGCDIGVLDNPYAKFALRDWERVRDSYTDYKFREARKTLEMMWQHVKEYFPDDASASVETMLNVLRCYEAWDAGDYNQAYAEAQKIPSFTPPDAVQMWGKNHDWVTISGVKFNPIRHFYEDTPRFRTYVYDELARIRRLIECNEDYLSAFLRAGGLNEVVMLARLVKSPASSPQREVLNKIDNNISPYAKPVFKGFVDGQFKWCKITWSLSMSTWWTGTSTMFSAKNGWETFLYRRNDLTHQYFSPPPEWAEDALAFVQANVEDLWGTDAGKDIKTRTLPWSEVCQLTGLEEYLPPNLLNDVSD